MLIRTRATCNESSTRTRSICDPGNDTVFGVDGTTLQAAVVFTADTWRNSIKEFVMQSINFIGFLCAIFLCFSAPKQPSNVTCKYANQPDAQDNSYAVHDGVCQRC